MKDSRKSTHYTDGERLLFWLVLAVIVLIWFSPLPDGAVR